MRIFGDVTDSGHSFCSSFCSHKRCSVPCNITGIEHQVALLQSRVIAPQVQELSSLCLEMDQESATVVDLKKHPKRQQCIINVLITKRHSIIVPKSHDNYLVHPNGVTFAIFNYFFWRFNSKIYGTYLVVYQQLPTMRIPHQIQ